MTKTERRDESAIQKFINSYWILLHIVLSSIWLLVCCECDPDKLYPNQKLSICFKSTQSVATAWRPVLARLFCTSEITRIIKRAFSWNPSHYIRYKIQYNPNIDISKSKFDLFGNQKALTRGNTNHFSTTFFMIPVYSYLFQTHFSSLFNLIR